MWEIAIHLIVAGDVFNGVFCLSFFPRYILMRSWTALGQFQGVSYLLFQIVYVMYLRNFGETPSTGSKDILGTKL